ncbi:GmrSD restriction endonuclease domain-containing protein [Schlesneria sp.]|uniref:GmrSD restriction endonuclease domain-containing protein n=1 Tax=Schlesneria sp. TaxID=2762018 RepID=UPI002EFCEF69
MKAIDRPFTKIINGTTQFVIPVFQRDYRWSEAQCEQLWRDIMLISKDETNRGHFMGSVVYVSTGDTMAGFTRWLLIDGQQRVTTLTLLMAALRDHIIESEWRGNEDSPTATRIDAYFLKNVQEEGGRRHKLVLRRHDQETLRAILDSTTLPTNPSERIRENYEFFRDQISTADPDTIYRGLDRLVVVDVTLDRGTDDPQLIFESLNFTGIDLSQSDLIRNFILMRLPEKQQTQLYDEHWSKLESLFRGAEKSFDSFLRDYLAFKTKAAKQERAEDIYQAFRREFPTLQQSCGGLELLLAEMLRLGRYYAAFSLGVPVIPELSDDLGRLRRLVDVPALLVMRLFDCYERCQSLSLTQFRDAIQCIESYVFRRAICGEQTHSYWQVFANLAYRIGEEKTLSDLKVELARQRDAYRFPRDADFRRELLQRDLYGLRVCGYLLERLENHGSKEPTNTTGLSIEHIMPQNEKLPEAWQQMLGPNWKEVQLTWLHRLGNLTMTGYNSTYSDRPFDEKKTVSGGFDFSAIRLNKFVREQKQWTPKEIEQRGKQLSDRALVIWPELVVDAAAVEAAKQAELKELAKRRNVAQVPMSTAARELFEELRPRLHDIDPSILELAESKSISYHASGFFLEVLPRKQRLTLLFPLDHGEIDDPHGLASDAKEWKFLVNAKHEGGVLLRIQDPDDIDRAIPIIRTAYKVANASEVGGAT